MAFFGQILAIFNQISAKFFCKNVIFEVALTGTNSEKKDFDFYQHLKALIFLRFLLWVMFLL